MTHVVSEVSNRLQKSRFVSKKDFAHIYEEMKVGLPARGVDFKQFDMSLVAKIYQPRLEVHEVVSLSNAGLRRSQFRYDWGLAINARHGFGSPEHGKPGEDTPHYHLHDGRAGPLIDLHISDPHERPHLLKDYFDWLSQRVAI